MADLLIVEDDPALRDGMLELLSIKGHQVRSADSGLAALPAIEARRPELIISDVIMPGLTGPQLLEAVRDRSEWHDIPFLFVSASTTAEIERQLDSTHRVSFLRKPFDIDTLFYAVLQALRDHPVGIDTQVRAQGISSQPPPYC
jgi:CheY-like chemotaxis protein